MNCYRTPPRDRPTTPPLTTSSNATEDVKPPTPTSLKWKSPKLTTHFCHAKGSELHAQTAIDSDPVTKRLQQDLLILTSFNDNSTLHWRPTWFTKGQAMWTLHNPPDVITELLPNDYKGTQLYTRRMRRAGDPPPKYITSWDHWERYCDLYRVPHDFLCEEQIRLMRMGLPRSPDGPLCTPPQYPLYPEPSSQDRYVLTPFLYSTHLPRKFQHVVCTWLYDDQTHSEHVVVEPDGKLTVTVHKDRSSYPRSSKGYRWSYLPWTTEMEKSCRPLTLKVRLWNEARERNKDHSKK